MTNSGVILRKLRELNHLSLKQAALKLERSVGWLSEIENDKGFARIKQTEFDRIVAVYDGEPYRKQFGAWISHAKVEVGKQNELSFDGSILKYLRTKAKLTASAAATRGNLSKSFLSDLENGKRRVNTDIRDRLLQIYGYSPASFRNFTSEDKRAANVPVRYKLDILLRKLTDKDVARVFSFAIENVIQNK